MRKICVVYMRMYMDVCIYFGSATYVTNVPYAGKKIGRLLRMRYCCAALRGWSSMARAAQEIWYGCIQQLDDRRRTG